MLTFGKSKNEQYYNQHFTLNVVYNQYQRILQ